MTVLTIRERARTFPLDQLLDARRRGVLICLGCGDEERPPLGSALCVNCTAFALRSPEDIICMNWGKP